MNGDYVKVFEGMVIGWHFTGKNNIAYDYKQVGGEYTRLNDIYEYEGVECYSNGTLQMITATQTEYFVNDQIDLSSVVYPNPGCSFFYYYGYYISDGTLSVLITDEVVISSIVLK